MRKKAPLETGNARASYSLSSAFVLTVGTVIGSGIFFKAPVILEKAGGGTGGLFAFLTGAAFMLLSALTVADIVVSSGADGTTLPDLVGNLLSPRLGLRTDRFFRRVYYPSMAAVLAYVGASYLSALAFPALSEPGILLLAVFLLAFFFGTNALLPLLSDRFRTAATLIKLLPLILMAVAGIPSGVKEGVLPENLSFTRPGGSFFEALPAAAFAFEGWITPAALGRSLKNARRNLPLALLAGSVTVTAVYLLFYLGLLGAAPADLLLTEGTAGAFAARFGAASSRWLLLAVVISCMGTLSGFSFVSGRVSGGRAGFLSACLWLLWYYFSTVHEGQPLGWFAFDNSELPIVTLYALYVPLFFAHMRRRRRYLLPALGILAAAGMVLAALTSHKAQILPYFLLSGLLLLGK